MSERTAELSPRKAARLAGVAYLILITAGIFAEFFVRSKFIVPGDAAATAANIEASQWLFRFGFSSDLVMVICDVLLALLLYIILRPVSRNLALLAVLLRLAMDATLAINMLNHFAAILLLSGANYLAVFPAAQLQALSLLALNAHEYGYLISQIFFGPHQLVLGYLVYRSGFFPRIFGALLMLSGVGYLIESFTLFLFPGHEALTYPGLAVAAVAEISFCLWLLIKGAAVPLKAQAE